LAGFCARVTIHRPNMALLRFTSDSMASASRPTEPVSHQAPVLSAMVSRAAATEASSKRWGVSLSRDRAAEKVMPSLWSGARLAHSWSMSQKSLSPK
jgi:hypothetical protein